MARVQCSYIAAALLLLLVSFCGQVSPAEFIIDSLEGCHGEVNNSELCISDGESKSDEGEEPALAAYIGADGAPEDPTRAAYRGADIAPQGPTRVAFRGDDDGAPPPVVNVGGRMLSNSDPEWGIDHGARDIASFRPRSDYKYEEGFRVPVVRVESRMLGDTMPNMLPGMYPGPIGGPMGRPMDEDRGIPGVSMGRDPPPKVLQFQGVPPGDAFMTDNTHD
ncbi:unnamed protein product, partial [Meganyctiphanes norvegica]